MILIPSLSKDEDHARRRDPTYAWSNGNGSRPALKMIWGFSS